MATIGGNGRMVPIDIETRQYGRVTNPEVQILIGPPVRDNRTMIIKKSFWLPVFVALGIVVLLFGMIPVVEGDSQPSLIGTIPAIAEATSTPEAEIARPKEVLRKEIYAVCSCESGNGKHGKPSQYESDGVTVKRGRVNSADIGMCQINAKYHEASAKKMGLDIFSEEGNIRYANHLYDTQGLRPWGASRSCWQ